MTPPELMALLSRGRFPLHAESATQASIEAFLTSHGVTFAREVSLTPADRIDFMVGDIGVEVKCNRANKPAIYRQLVRYALRHEVAALILATNKAMGLPPLIEGKPVYYLSLGRGWL